MVCQTVAKVENFVSQRELVWGSTKLSDCHNCDDPHNRGSPYGCAGVIEPDFEGSNRAHQNDANVAEERKLVIENHLDTHDDEK